MENQREQLLKAAGIDFSAQVEAIKKAWARKMELLDALAVRYFAHEGVVTDLRETPDNKIRLEAAESLERMLGVIAPKAEQKVVVVHRVELPDWARPDEGAVKVIDVRAEEA